MMRRVLGITAVIASVVLGCAHTRHVGQEGDDTSQQQSSGNAGRSGAPARAPRVPPRAGRPAVAASPEGLMNPGSAQKIQQALHGKGYLSEVSGELDPATSAALRRFQHDRGLAETGAPDRETLQRLGVDPQEVYRSVPEGHEATGGK